MTSTQHDEVERKYDVDPAAILPSLTDVDGVSSVGQPVEHQLEALYFETAEGGQQPRSLWGVTICSVIEFGDGPTHAQVHEVFQETTVLLTMLTHPTMHGAPDWSQQAERTYALSPPHSLVALASIGAGRFWRLSRSQAAGEGPQKSAPFPRAVLQTVPSDGRPDLLFLAIDLVETVARGGRTRPLVDQLLVDRVRAYRVLVSVVHELGWLAARADRAVNNLVDLVALETVTAEQDWYDSQNSR